MEKESKMTNYIVFPKDEEGLKLCAVYVAQLTREGLTFELKDKGNRTIGCWIEVHLTGGY
jgi:hypothetical protein